MGDAGRMIEAPTSQSNRVYLSGETDTPLDSAVPFPTSIVYPTVGGPSDMSDAIVLTTDIAERQNHVPQPVAGPDNVYNVDSIPYTVLSQGQVADSGGIPWALWEVLDPFLGSAPIITNPHQTVSEPQLHALGTYAFQLTADDCVDQSHETVTIQLQNTTGSVNPSRRVTQDQNPLPPARGHRRPTDHPRSGRSPRAYTRRLSLGTRRLSMVR